MRELLRRAAGVVLDGVVGLEGSGKNLEKRNMSRKGIGDGFEDVKRKRLAVCNLHSPVGAGCSVSGGSGLCRADLQSRALGGRRCIGYEKIQQMVSPNVSQPRSIDHREDPVFANSFVQGGDE